MFKIGLIAAAAVALPLTAQAAPKWVELPHTLADVSLLDRNSFAEKGEYVDVDVMRNYKESINLGNDPVSGDAMYSHRSVKLNYVVDCESRKIAMKGWTLYDGNFGGGEVVWSDRNWGAPSFINANDEESRSVVISACATLMAAR